MAAILFVRDDPAAPAAKEGPAAGAESTAPVVPEEQAAKPMSDRARHDAKVVGRAVLAL
jgi:hypothetical protein